MTALVALGGCASPHGPPMGLLYSDVKGPVAVTSSGGTDRGYNGFGEASAVNVFGLFAVGDASINAAKLDGARRTGSNFPQALIVSHVDYQWSNFLGLGRYTARVYFYDPNSKQKP